jgi:RNA polymerase sigma-70 factor (ECF subfamily)
VRSLGGTEGREREAGLVRRAQDGDQRAYEDLVRTHDRRIFAIIGGFVRRRQDVEDLAQEVFLKAYLAIGQFRPGEPFAPWLNRIAVNTCYDHLRSLRRRQEISFADLSEREADFLSAWSGGGSRSGGGGPEARAVAGDLADRILATLSPKDRLVITLREVQGLEIAEIASALGCSRPAAKVRLFRARRAMQAALRQLLRQEQVMADRGRRRGSNDVP